MKKLSSSELNNMSKKELTALVLQMQQFQAQLQQQQKQMRQQIHTLNKKIAIMNTKYTNAIPLYRIAQDFEPNDMILERITGSSVALSGI